MKAFKGDHFVASMNGWPSPWLGGLAGLALWTTIPDFELAHFLLIQLKKLSIMNYFQVSSQSE